MKAILVFNLPSENDTYSVCVHSGKFFSALHEIDGILRNKIKHGNYSEEIQDMLQEIRNLIPNEVHDIG